MKHLFDRRTLATEANALAAEIDAAIQADGIVHPRVGKPYFAYELDGFGSVNFMDDANIPSRATELATTFRE